MTVNNSRTVKSIALIAIPLITLISVLLKSSWITSFYQIRETSPKPNPLSLRLPAPPRSLSWRAARRLEALNRQKVAQDDPKLLKMIRDYFIFPPSRKPYHLENPNVLDYSRGQAPFVDSRLEFMESGFFVECGALDGEKRSNTLFLERVRHWNGLLIEADPETFKELKSKNRKAFTMNACLNPYGFPAKIRFNKAYNRGRLMHNNISLKWIKEEQLTVKFITVQCFPFYSILLAMNQTRVDFFSLDIEGDELSVLKTIPWDRVDIRMLTVEFLHDVGKSKELQKYMESVGYETLLKMQRDDNTVNDLIFKKAVITQ